MEKERILQLILIAIITLFVLTLTSCATAHQQCSAYALNETK
jgi:hypothetical protein